MAQATGSGLGTRDSGREEGEKAVIKREGDEMSDEPYDLMPFEIF